MTIRPFEQNDFNECVKFFIETYNSQPWNYHWNIDNAAKYLSEYISSGEFLGFVLIDESGIPAVMFGHAKTWWTGNSLFIDELFVLPKKQGLGYGKMLMQYAERYCKENNFGILH